MLGLNDTLRFYIFNGKTNLRVGYMRLCVTVRDEMGCNPRDSRNVYVFINRSCTIIRMIHYERGFYVLYEKQPETGRFRRPVYCLSQKEHKARPRHDKGCRRQDVERSGAYGGRTAQKSGGVPPQSMGPPVQYPEVRCPGDIQQFVRTAGQAIKLSLRNCLNIGSEEAARKHAFMHSLAESCRLCSVNIADYFTDLFRHARSTLSSDDLRGLLPNHYCAKC